MRDEHRDADNYTSDMTTEYENQGRLTEQAGRGRQYADFSYQNFRGGTEQLKPLTPDYSRLHYDQEGDYVTVRRDKWNNEFPDPAPNHETATAEEGEYGGRQYSDFQRADGYSGYGVEIPHGSGAAFKAPETVWVDNSKADRGRDA